MAWPSTAEICITVSPSPIAPGKSLSSSALVVLASDGLWDVTSTAVAMRIARSAATPSDAADLLLRHARRVYCEERGLSRPGDDTTVMVVDINPSLSEFVPPPQQDNYSDSESGGCSCVLS